MRRKAIDRVTLLTYFSVFIGLLVIVGFAARDVLFERFTYRIGAEIVGGSDVAYVIGGRSAEGDPYRHILLVDPSENIIRVRPGLEFDLHGSSVVESDNGVMILGGTTQQGYSDVIYEFNRESGEIEEAGELPAPLAYAASAVIGDAIYLAGGYDGSRRHDGIIRVDPTTAQSAVIARLPEPRDGMSAAAHGDSLFVIGGDGPEGKRYADILELDPLSGTLLRRLELPHALAKHSAAVDGDRLVILGVDYGNRNVLVTLDLSVPGNRQLVERPVEIDGRSCVVVNAGGRLLAVGSVHPDVARQLGIWSLDSRTGEAEPMRYHSRIWH